MKHHALCRSSVLCHRPSRPTQWLNQYRSISSQTYQRRSDVWIPTVKINKQDGVLDATELLARAGYLWQAYSGIYHMLPLGLRVQDKVEKLIDKHMSSIGASKVSLSSISSQSLWQKSGRLTTGSELFTFKDRKDAKWLLSPTHEEEITTLVADYVYGSADLPIRLYQVGRKYRDEKRPRGGLLRGREFVMKDLYTFDVNETEAHATYDQVRRAYRSFLAELKLPYIEARADSGNMGGDLSHEYHFPSRAGEDDVISCTSCDYARNEEFFPPFAATHQKFILSPGQTSINSTVDVESFMVQNFVSRDMSTLVRTVAPRLVAESTGMPRELNTYAIKAAFDGISELDTGVEDPLAKFNDHMKVVDGNGVNSTFSVHYLIDKRLDMSEVQSLVAHDREWIQANNLDVYTMATAANQSNGIDILKQASGDNCPQCTDGKLKVEKAVEVGHTFHLGTRYSSKLSLNYQDKSTNTVTPVQMGCHGIGVSRLVAAVAGCLSDRTGLIWPRAVAPYEVVILVKRSDKARLEAAEKIYDELIDSRSDAADVLLDDRDEHSLGWKLKDADAIGYPVVIVIGKGFETDFVEVQCRRLGMREQVKLDQAASHVYSLLQKL